MPLDVRHQYVSAVASNGDPSVVQGPDWNAAHKLLQGPSALLGRSDSAPGQAPTVEVSLDPATLAFVGGQLKALYGSAGYAPINSPLFTGDPQAPTPPAADNDTSIATTAFVKTQAYAPLASPVFTGTLTAADINASSLITVTRPDGNLGILIRGVSKGFRVIPSATGTEIAGVDNTGFGTFQPLTINGNPITLLAPTTMNGALTYGGVTLSYGVTGTGSMVLSGSPALTGNPTAPTAATADNSVSLATTAFVKAQGYAPIASPVFTGDPQAPTPATADNDTSVATTAFVKAQGYVTGGPYAPLASPALTGNPTAPTAAAADNSVSLATTAFVKAALAGAGNKLLQTVFVETGAVATGATVIPFDDTIPQSNEGDQYMSLAITPQNATSKLVIDVVFNAGVSAAVGMIMALFQDATANALAAGFTYVNIASGRAQLVLRHVMTSGTTALTTFKVRVGPDGAATVTFNGSNSGRLFGGAMASSIVIQEVM